MSAQFRNDRYGNTSLTITDRKVIGELALLRQFWRIQNGQLFQLVKQHIRLQVQDRFAAISLIRSNNILIPVWEQERDRVTKPESPQPAPALAIVFRSSGAPQSTVQYR
jgi:hypothetical protein